MKIERHILILLGLITLACAEPPASLDQVRLGGAALHRAELNLNHLHTEMEYFDPASSAFPNTGWIAQWPGDTSGRLLLGLCRAYQVTGVKSSRIDGLLKRLPQNLNPAGYMGAPLPAGLMDEQYLAGNGWLIRALCAHYRIFGDPDSKELAARVLNGLLQPALQAFPSYPVGKVLQHDGEPGQVSKVGVVDGWRMTNDIGSGFMFIDAATDAYELLPSPELARLIDVIIGKFRQYNAVKSKAQTHATLTTCRGLLRHARRTGDSSLVQLVAGIWNSYRSLAMTENYENWVWFGRPDWTEGCAVVDSFEVAMELWRLTGRSAYLQDAQLIWHNAIPYNQWPNGGFGTCDCAGAKGTSGIKHQFEAPWCYSMRGAEGFLYVRDAVLAIDQSALTWFTMTPHSAKFHHQGQEGLLRLETDFPTDGNVRLTLDHGSLPTMAFRFFLPAEWLDGPVAATRNGQSVPVKRHGDFVVLYASLAAGDRIQLALPLGIRQAVAMTAAMRRDWHRFMHGPLVLAAPIEQSVVLPQRTKFIALGEGRYRAADTNLVLSPLATSTWPNMDAPKKDTRMVLFRERPVSPDSESASRQP